MHGPAADIPPLSPADRALLLELTDPARAQPDPAAADALAHAHFLARPDIQPHLEALQRFRAFRAEIERDHQADQAIDALLEVARTTTDLVEKRLAATAVIRLLLSPPNGARRASEGHGARSASEGHASSARGRRGSPPSADQSGGRFEVPAPGPSHDPVSSAAPAPPRSAPSTPSMQSLSSTTPSPPPLAPKASPDLTFDRVMQRLTDALPETTLEAMDHLDDLVYGPSITSDEGARAFIDGLEQLLAALPGAAPEAGPTEIEPDSPYARRVYTLRRADEAPARFLLRAYDDPDADDWSLAELVALDTT